MGQSWASRGPLIGPLRHIFKYNMGHSLGHFAIYLNTINTIWATSPGHAHICNKYNIHIINGMLMRARDNDNYGKKVAEKSIEYGYQNIY